MGAADIKKIKDLEDENRLLKQMFADLSLENRALKDVIWEEIFPLDQNVLDRLMNYTVNNIMY